MTFGITPLNAPIARTEFPGFVQWQDEGVDLGAPNVRVINFTGDPALYQVTRGTGENSNVITVRAPDLPTDPMFGDLLLLMPGSSLTDDLSPLNNTIDGSGTGGMEVSSAQTLFGLPTLYSPPTPPSNGLSVPYGTSYIAANGGNQGGTGGFMLGSQDFSFECFTFINSSPAGGSHSSFAISTAGAGVPILIGQSVALGFWSARVGFDGASWPVSIGTGVAVVRNQWVFVQLIRNGSNFTFALNGTVVGTATFAGSIDVASATTGQLVFASNQGFVTGTHTAQTRITRGVRPIAVPTEPWPLSG